ncbi:MAG: helix-turn-helix domain-containing protein [Candidatus Dojkabacteria bacterium]
MYNRTIGERLKTERERLWLSLDEVSNATRISKKYLEAIEENDFEIFSSHTQAIGFIKNYSNFLKIDPVNIIAIYKRDFEAVKQTRKIHKIDDDELEKARNPTLFDKFKQTQLTSKRVWALTSILLILVFVILTTGFIKSAFSPPYFKIIAPINISVSESKDFSTSNKTIQIKGETAGYTLIKLNEIPLVLSTGFTFESEELPITSEVTKFVITAESQLGVKSQAILNIKREDIEKRNAKKDIVISTSLSGILVKATVDNIIQYNDLTTTLAPVNLSVAQTFTLETDNYSVLTISYNNKLYQPKANTSKFIINDSGDLIQE